MSASSSRAASQPANHQTGQPSQAARAALQVIERAIASGNLGALVHRLDGAVVRQAQRQCLGLVHAAMRLSDCEREAALRRLVELGADLDGLDTDNRSALHEAVDRYDLEGVDLLIVLGANVDVLDGSGKTPLHWSAKNGRVTPATRLISAGAALMVRDDAGKAFLDLGDESFVQHIELLMDVRHTMYRLDVALEKHGGIPIPADTTGGCRSPGGYADHDSADSSLICGD